jgi:hypothetical protein
MKTANVIIKIVAALAAVAGVVFVIATFGDKIVAWAKKLMGCCPCDGECECCCEDECFEEAAEETEEAAEEVAEETEEVVEEAAEEAVEEPVAAESDFE